MINLNIEEASSGYDSNYQENGNSIKVAERRQRQEKATQEVENSRTSEESKVQDNSHTDTQNQSFKANGK